MAESPSSAEQGVSEVKNLHLGCFDQVVEGWINTDVTPHIFVAKLPFAASALRMLGKIDERRYAQHRQKLFKNVRYLNVKKRFPFASERFDNAFSSHMLEHLYVDEAKICVREVHRILKRGGVFRISVPDLDSVVRSYEQADPEAFLTAMYESGESRDKNRHHWMYSERTLKELLIGSGFDKVYRCAYREGRCPDLIELDNRPEVSLFMEAIK